ncbi:PREDICTED: spermatid maturation protein 1 [Elephantulus edwardii]|uniref:spermatid maturation protein 1 n=1 Tax=Elephantulus edwardii TaxID=28737 RepID=UPI0003F0599F|nr:PREDICTED: spermatid maturation protein 1 [Elephantulus edwardii]
MAIAEQTQPGWASYHNPHTTNCQDLGNSILLLLGLIICINIGINLVTLLWQRLRYFLCRMFNNICVKETCTSSLSGKQTTSKPSRRQSRPEVHIRCTMDPVKMTMTPPPSRRCRHRDLPAHCDHHPVSWNPDNDNKKPLPQHPASCAHNWEPTESWASFQANQGIWDPWAQDSVEPSSQAIRLQQTKGGRPHKTDVHSEVGLEAYVYPVNPPPSSCEALNNKNSRAEAEVTHCSQPPVLGPAMVPDIPQRRSSVRVVYDALDVRRRLRELTREIEALSQCYPLPPKPLVAERTEQSWIYRPVVGK